MTRKFASSNSFKASVIEYFDSQREAQSAHIGAHLVAPFNVDEFALLKLDVLVLAWQVNDLLRLGFVVCFMTS